MPPRRLPYLYEGEVTRRDDPLGLGRVKILIPGIIEPETPNWAWPKGAPGGGSAQRGHWEPPAIGATVMVQFKLGELDYPYYECGPWGEPAGVSDVPTNAEVEGADRQNAVTEDEEWRIERDSRTGVARYLIRHTKSSLAVFVDGVNDKIFFVRENATQQFVRGTEYRTAEVAYLGGLHGILRAFSIALGAAADIAAINTIGVALKDALDLLPTSPFIDDDTAYLSDNARTE